MSPEMNSHNESDDFVMEALVEIGNLPLGSTLSDYADTIGRHPMSVSRWVNGNSHPDAFRRLTKEQQEKIEDWRNRRYQAKADNIRRFLRTPPSITPAKHVKGEKFNATTFRTWTTKKEIINKLSPEEQTALEKRLRTKSRAESAQHRGSGQLLGPSGLAQRHGPYDDGDAAGRGQPAATVPVSRALVPTARPQQWFPATPATAQDAYSFYNTFGTPPSSFAHAASANTAGPAPSASQAPPTSPASSASNQSRRTTHRAR